MTKLMEIVEYGKKEGKINQGLIALWTGLGPSATYLFFKQIRELCLDGKLDDNEYICYSTGDQVIFRKRQEGETK